MKIRQVKQANDFKLNADLEMLCDTSICQYVIHQIPLV